MIRDRLAIARTSAFFGFLGATGAAFVVAGLVSGVLAPLLLWGLHFDELVNSFFYGPHTIGVSGIDSATTVALSLAAAAAAAVFVARRASGRAGVALYGVLVVATAVSSVLASVMYVRSLTGECCVIITVENYPIGVALMFAPALLVITYALIRPAGGATPSGSNALLEAAGTYAIVGMVAAAAVFRDVRLPLLLSPYGLAGLDATPHAAVVFAETAAAAVIYAARARAPSLAGALAFATILGIAAVLLTELDPLVGVVFFQHSYIPQSLVLVPVGAAAAFAVAWTTRRAIGAISWI